MRHYGDADGMRADRKDPVIATLRRFKPTKFEVVLVDGTKKNVPLSTKTNRWEQLLNTLDALKWTSIEAQDGDGATLGVVERELADELEDDIDDEIVKSTHISKLMLSVMSTTMSEVRKMFADTMKAQAEMSRSMLDSHHVVVESFQLALKVQAAALQTVPGADANGDDKMMEMFKMAMMLKAGGTPAINVGVNPPAKPAAKAPAAPVNGSKPA